MTQPQTDQTFEEREKAKRIAEYEAWWRVREIQGHKRPERREE